VQPVAASRSSQNGWVQRFHGLLVTGFGGRVAWGTLEFKRGDRPPEISLAGPGSLLLGQGAIHM
jgi:hypothetical protein